MIIQFHLALGIHLASAEQQPGGIFKCTTNSDRDREVGQGFSLG